MNVEDIKREIQRVYQDIQHLGKNRISNEMIRRYSILYETSGEFKSMVNHQRSLENNAFRIWRERIRTLKALLKHP